MPRLIGEQGPEAFEKQAIPLEPDLMEIANYKTFLAERRKRIAKALNDFLDAPQLGELRP